MTIGEISKIVLNDSEVFKAIKTCLKDENEKRFLIYLKEDGSINMGGIIHENEKKLRELQEVDLSKEIKHIFDYVFSERYLQLWSEFAYEEFVSSIKAYNAKNMTPIDKKSGMLILTKWRENELTLEDEITIRNALPRKNPLDLPSMTLCDFFELNLLKEYHPVSILIRGELTFQDYVSLLIAQQNGPQIDLETIKKTMMSELAAFISEREYPTKGLYQVVTGSINLENRIVTLNSDFKKNV